MLDPMEKTNDNGKKPNDIFCKTCKLLITRYPILQKDKRNKLNFLRGISGFGKFVRLDLSFPVADKITDLHYPCSSLRRE